MLTKLVYINSRTRISGTDSSFTHKVDLNNFDPDYVAVLSASIPKSYYLIQNNQNTFILSENGNDITVFVPIGTYTRNTFKTVIETTLNNASPNLWTYSVTIPAITSVDTGKYTYIVTDNGGLQPSFTFLTGNLFEVMGFNQGSTYTFVNDKLVSENVIKMQLEDSLFIRSDLSGERSNNILQEIYSYGSDYNSIVFHNHATDYYKKQINSNSSGVYSFYLTNEDGNLMELNGLNWTMTLCFIVSDKTPKYVQEYIKYKVKS